MEPDPLPDTLGMCGVYCAAGPCIRKMTCKGCGSDDPRQRRVAKWRCKIRICVREKHLRHCGECKEFPCTMRRSLDRRYLDRYGIDLQDNIRKLAELGPDRWIAFHRKTFTCPKCGDVISPYTRACYSCGLLSRDKN
jgi:hypothetical protein